MTDGRGCSVSENIFTGLKFPTNPTKGCKLQSETKRVRKEGQEVRSKEKNATFRKMMPLFRFRAGGGGGGGYTDATLLSVR